MQLHLPRLPAPPPPALSAAPPRLGDAVRPRVRALGVPSSLGAGTRGAELGPAALRIAGLDAWLARGDADAGDLVVPEARGPELASARRATAVSALCRSLYLAVDEIVSAGELPLILGGDHAIAAGSVAAMSDAVAAAGGTLGVVWIDAHGDANTPATSPTGNLHGMPLAALLGADVPIRHLTRRAPRLRAADVALVGARALDPGERQLFESLGLVPVPPSPRGIDIDAVLGRLGHCTHLYVSFDVDALDPGEAPGVGTPVQGGLAPAHVRALFAALCRDGRVCGAEIVEVNPLLDERNRTARLAVALLGTLLSRSEACDWAR